MKKVLLFALVIVAVCTVAVVAQDVADGGDLSDFAVMITTALAGTLGVWLAQGVKKVLPWGLGDKLMTWIAFGCAFVVAIVAFAICGGLKELFSNPWVTIQNLATSGGFMTLAYATLKGRLGIKAKSQMDKG